MEDTILAANIGPCTGDGLVIGVSGITLNCAGHTITGQTGSGSTQNIGVNLTGVSRVTVENCNAPGFDTSFFLMNSSDNILIGNTANGITLTGFFLGNSSSNTFLGNTESDSYAGNGFYVTDSSNNTFSGNTVNSNSGSGFFFYGSSNSNLTMNEADNDLAGGFVLYNSSSITLSENTANSSGGSDGFYLLGFSNSTLIKNTADNDHVNGFYLTGSSGNSLTGNIANNNKHYGYYDDSVGSGNSEDNELLFWRRVRRQHRWRFQPKRAWLSTVLTHHLRVVVQHHQNRWFKSGWPH